MSPRGPELVPVLLLRPLLRPLFLPIATFLSSTFASPSQSPPRRPSPASSTPPCSLSQSRPRCCGCPPCCRRPENCHPPGLTAVVASHRTQSLPRRPSSASSTPPRSLSQSRPFCCCCPPCCRRPDFHPPGLTAVAVSHRTQSPPRLVGPDVGLEIRSHAHGRCLYHFWFDW